MHRRTKGLLSLMMAFVMVTAMVSTAFANELPQGQPTAEETAITSEAVEPQTTVETAAVEEQAETESKLMGDEAKSEAVPSTVTEESPITEAVQTDSQEQPVAETEQVKSTGDPTNDDLYPSLEQDQIKFEVYKGTQPIQELLSDADILSKLYFMEDGVVPDSADLDRQAGTILAAILDSREGDDRFYRLTNWRLWSVDSSGKPQSIADTKSALSKLATTQNFINCAYMENNGTGTSPKILCKNPILEPIWSCIDYLIPVYDAQGQDTGITVTVNAENYHSVVFPNVEADSWKLIYDGSEYQLNSASEIWTNTTNGIGTIGRNFNEKNAKLQAYKLPVEDEVKYEISGPQGSQGWYTGTVTVRAKDGYQIRLSQSDEWSDAVCVTESGNVTIFLKKSDGTELPAETLSFLIDQTAPVISGIQNGGTYYRNEVPVVVTDEHLRTVTVNGGAVGIFDNRADIMLRPSENPYIIAAEDMAGNWIECIVWVKEDPATETPSEEPSTEPSTEAPSEEPSTEAPSEEPSTEPSTEVPSEPSTETPDKTAPVISGVSDGDVYYGSQAVTVTDENLVKVTVNGKEVKVSDHRAEFVLNPSDDEYQFVIIAEDMAGNRMKYTVEVWETWVRDGITTNGKKQLRQGRIYKLGKGQWTVNGDSTVYQGDRTFYVKKSGTYNFKKK